MKRHSSNAIEKESSALDALLDMGENTNECDSLIDYNPDQ